MNYIVFIKTHTQESDILPSSITVVTVSKDGLLNTQCQDTLHCTLYDIWYILFFFSDYVYGYHRLQLKKKRSKKERSLLKISRQSDSEDTMLLSMKA